jgi:hypothetical protein
VNLPGSVAEANSNALPGRTLALPGDPLIAAAEQTIRESGAAVSEPASEPVSEPGYAPVSAPVPEPGHAVDDAPAFAETEAEAEAETTMQVRLPVVPEFADVPEFRSPDPYAIGPDRHERTADEFPAPTAAPAPTPTPAPTPAPAPVADALPGPRAAEPQERITDKGLPKRTPKVVKPTTASSTERKGSLDKEALRRRLGGFHQGAKNGRRDVEAEIAEITATQPFPAAAAHAGRPARTEHSDPAHRNDGRTDETGDTVEEARS